MRCLKTLLCSLFLTVSFVCFSQDSLQKDGLIRRYINSLLYEPEDPAQPQFLIYPTFAFSPETNWEFGLSALYVYYAKRDTANRLSEISGFTFYTLENQYGIFLDHALYSDNDDYFFLGRLRYQSFPLLFYGIGPNTPSEHIARVDGNFILLKERFLRKVYHSFYIGAELDYQHLGNVDFNHSDPENPGDIPPGGNGSSNFGMGVGIVYDNRHNVLNVRDGLFSELAFLRYDDAWGSDFSFTSLVSDTRIFKPVNKRNVIAAQLFGQFTVSGQAPFNQLALMGGESIMRGYYLGRYRDNNLVAAQLEYRFLPLPLGFTDRVGASLFTSVGQVFGQESNFNFSKFLPTGGAGLKFLLFPKKDIYTRFDVAFTREGTGFYIFIGEAF